MLPQTPRVEDIELGRGVRPSKDVHIPYSPRDIQWYIHDQVSRHRFSVIVAHRRMGKTVLVINQLIKSATLCGLDRPRYGYIAPFFTQAKSIAWDYLKHYTAPLPGLTRNESELWIEIPSIGTGNARIRLYGADNPDAIRGVYFDGVIIDEVAQCKPEIWGEVVRPCLMDRGGWAIFIGTPKVQNLFYELYNHALRNDDWFTELFPVSKTNILSPVEIEEARKQMSEKQFRQEMLCDFTASSDDVLIPLDLAQRAAKRVNHPKTWSWAPVTMGVDVARFGDDTNPIYVRQGLHTLYTKRYRDMDLMTFADHVASNIQRFNVDMVFVDMVGIGAGVYDRLMSLGFTNVIGVNGGFSPDDAMYRNKRAEMWSKMKQWLEAGGDIPDDPSQIQELTSVQYKYDVTDRLVLEKKVDMKKRGMPSPDMADALSMTFFMPVQRGVGGMGYEDEDYAEARNSYQGRMTGY